MYDKMRWHFRWMIDALEREWNSTRRTSLLTAATSQPERGALPFDFVCAEHLLCVEHLLCAEHLLRAEALEMPGDMAVIPAIAVMFLFC